MRGPKANAYWRGVQFAGLHKIPLQRLLGVGMEIVSMDSIDGRIHPIGCASRCQAGLDLYQIQRPPAPGGGEEMTPTFILLLY
jgi:hypothetical protein